MSATASCNWPRACCVCAICAFTSTAFISSATPVSTAFRVSTVRSSTARICASIASRRRSRRENGVKQLLHFECDLVRRAARVGPCTRGIGASRIHLRVSSEVVRDRLRQSRCAQEEVRVALRKRYRGARQRPDLRVHAEGALRDLDPLLITDVHGAGIVRERREVTRPGLADARVHLVHFLAGDLDRGIVVASQAKLPRPA